MNKINNDIKTAVETLVKENLTICAVKKNLIEYKSKDNGIAPLYKAYDSMISFDGCSVADKVVGLGAAYFYKKLGSKQIYANIVSKSALEYLNANSVDVQYNILVDRILNREKNGFCPVESMAIKSTSFEEFLSSVKSFLLSLKLI